MTLFDRVADRALALAASGAGDDDAVCELRALAQDSQLALDVARSLVWLRHTADPACRRRADDLLTETIARCSRSAAAQRRRPAPRPRRQDQVAAFAGEPRRTGPFDPAVAASVRVRHAARADAGTITAIHLAAWRAGLRGRVPAKAMDEATAEEWAAQRRALLGASPSEGHVWVATVASQVVGFVRAGTCQDRDRDEGSGQVDELSVHPRWAGGGVERALLVAVADALALRGCRRAVMWVRRDDHRLRRACHAAGWRADGGGRRRQQIGGPVAELRYSTELPAKALVVLEASASRSA